MGLIKLLGIFFILHSLKGSSGSVLSVVADFVYSGYEMLKCPFGDCCNNYWIPNNITSMLFYLNFNHCFNFIISRAP